MNDNFKNYDFNDLIVIIREILSDNCNKNNVLVTDLFDCLGVSDYVKMQIIDAIENFLECKLLEDDVSAINSINDVLIVCYKKFENCQKKSNEKFVRIFKNNE